MKIKAAFISVGAFFFGSKGILGSIFGGLSGLFIGKFFCTNNEDKIKNIMEEEKKSDEGKKKKWYEI